MLRGFRQCLAGCWSKSASRSEPSVRLIEARAKESRQVPRLSLLR